MKTSSLGNGSGFANATYKGTFHANFPLSSSCLSKISAFNAWFVQVHYFLDVTGFSRLEMNKCTFMLFILHKYSDFDIGVLSQDLNSPVVSFTP